MSGRAVAAYQRARVGGFSEDARTAIEANPDYFVKWYTAKSFMLVGALGIAAYFAGRASRSRR